MIGSRVWLGLVGLLRVQLDFRFRGYLHGPQVLLPLRGLLFHLVGFRVQGLVFRVWDSGFGVWGLGF